MSNERFRINSDGSFGIGTSMSYNGISNVTPVAYTLVSEKLKEWDWLQRFIETNPDLKDRWEQHKTYEILKDEQV